MATQPPVQCPVCHEELARDQTLKGHLVEAHTKQELAKEVVSEVEAIQAGETLD